MKKIILILTLALFTGQANAFADVYVKVDAAGNAIGGAIMCDAATCGAGSEYARLTLGEGERYVLQGVGVDYGIGNNNPDTSVRHESASNEWVITRTPDAGSIPSTERFTVITQQPLPVVQPVQPDSPTVIDSQTAIIDSLTVFNDTATALFSLDGFDWSSFWIDFRVWFEQFFYLWGRL